MSSTFIRTEENFVCQNCGRGVVGNGYTNHCPTCLFSKHVDINPGDRKNLCGGIMEPISIDQKRGGYVIVHRCTKCGAEKRNRAADNDSVEAIIAVASSSAEKNKGAV